jgi:hypothetical protein
MPKGAEFGALRRVLESQQPLSMLVTDASAAKSDDIFVSYHAAVVLESDTPWDAQAFGAALKDALRLKLTTGDLGLTWQQRDSYFELDGMQPLYFAVVSKFCVVANDATILSEVLKKVGIGAAQEGQPMLRESGFNHEYERENFARATTLIDLDGAFGRDKGTDTTPRFFSGNIRSLSDTFARMKSEEIREYWTDGVLHQSVVYKWKPRGM